MLHYTYIVLSIIINIQTFIANITHNLKYRQSILLQYPIHTRFTNLAMKHTYVYVLLPFILQSPEDGLLKLEHVGQCIP